MSLPALHVRVARSPSSERVQLPSLNVLILEDEPRVADGLQRLLVREGHRASRVAVGARVSPVWQSAKTAGEPFDVALLDLVQPGGLGGLATLEQLRTVDPDARAVVMSGYSENPVMARYREHGFNARLAKPFRLDQLKRALSDALMPSSD